jgi:hypothetical protein
VLSTGNSNRESDESRFYRRALRSLLKAEVPFLVGGAYALEVHTGIVRRTKDFDIFVRPQHAQQTLDVLAAEGYLTEMSFPHWIGKAFHGEDFIDVIFRSGNGICTVDDEWFLHSVQGNVLGMDLALCPAEETIWQKAFILERDRCDVADVAHLFQACAARIDWPRLLRRFAEHWRVLLAQLVLFEFVFPGEQQTIPREIVDELIRRRQTEIAAEKSADRLCRGTLLSATQYLREIDEEGYQDARLKPVGNMTRQEIAIWTANFMEPRR